MIPTKLNPLGFNPYSDGVMEFEKVGNYFNDININYAQHYLQSFELVDNGFRAWGNFESSNYGNIGNGQVDTRNKITTLPKGEYTLSFDVVKNQETQSHQCICANFFSNNIGNYVGTYYRPYINDLIINGEPTRLSTTFIVDEDTTGYIVFRLNNYDLTITNIAIKSGTDTVYEPYNNLYRCYGESTQYQNDGRNLIPLPDYELEYVTSDELCYANWTIKDSRIKLVSDFTAARGSYECTLKLTNGYRPQYTGAAARQEYFLPPGTYTISMHNKIGGGSAAASPALRLTTTENKLYQVTWNNSKGVTFTTEDPIAFAHIHGYNSKIDCEFNIQIEAGSTMTEWKPYTTNPTPTIENPSSIISNYPKGRYKTNLEGITIKLDDDLRSVPCGIADYVEVDMSTKEKKIVRQIFKATTTENDKFSSNAEYGDYFRQIPHDKVWGTGQTASNNDTSINTLCTHLKSCASSTTNSITGMWPGRLDPTFSGQSARGSQLMFKDPSFIDDNAFKQFLSKKVEVCFALAEPIITLL